MNAASGDTYGNHYTKAGKRPFKVMVAVLLSTSNHKPYPSTTDGTQRTTMHAPWTTICLTAGLTPA